MKGKVFNIQRFSIHDGPNIRTTVFLKGCPLRCKWCHNPESFNAYDEMMWNQDKCSYCMKCVEICPQNAVSLKDNRIVTDYLLCDSCGLCEIYCVNSARQLVGKDYEVDELVKEILKDQVIFEESNGGVTFSGGEPLMQSDFLAEVMKKLKQKNIHIAVDTSGFTLFENIEKIIPYVDLFLYDLKIADNQKHIEYTGVSNKLIIENLIQLSKHAVEINLRMPMISGINTTPSDIKGILDIIHDIKISRINLLPYHHLSGNKYKKLDLTCYSFNVPTQEELEEIKQVFEDAGYLVNIGG